MMISMSCTECDAGPECFGACWGPGGLAGCAGSTARGGAVLGSSRGWAGGLCSGRGGAADVELGGDGAGGDVGRGVSERLTALDLSWAVPVPVGGDPGGGDLAEGGLVGGGPGLGGQAGGGGPGPDRGDHDPGGRGEGQVPGLDRLPDAGSFRERSGDGGG